MFIVKAQLTNVKAPRNDEGTLTTTPTDGNMRISPLGAQLMGVGDEDYLAGVLGEDANGDDVFALFKGAPGTETEAPVGAKLASPSGKPGSSLNFSSANLYEKLGGGQGKNRVWKIDAENKVESEGITYFPLTFLRDEEPQERKSRSENGSGDESAEMAQTADTQA